MTSLNSDHRVGMKVHKESPTHDFCAHVDNVNLETSHSTENIPRVLHVDSAVSVRDPKNGSVNSSVSLTEDFVNFTFSFPKSYFIELSYALSEEMKKPKTMAIESTSNSSEQSDCHTSQSKGTSDCTNMNTPANQDLCNVHEIMKNRENLTCEFPNGTGSSNDNASIESEDENQASSEVIENCKSTFVKKTSTTSNNHKNLDAFKNCRNVQIKLQNSTAEETDDCCINTDLIESMAEVAIISEDDSQNVQILGITNENVNIVQNNFDESSFGKYDSAEREANLTTETFTGSRINRQEYINQIQNPNPQENLEIINQTSIEILNIVENDESENDKLSFKGAESGKDTNSSQININFNKSKLEESQNTWKELFPLQKIKKIHTKEMKFATVHPTAKYFMFKILEKSVVVKVMTKSDADISVEVVTLNSLERLKNPSTYKNILDKEGNVQNSEKHFGLIEPNEQCHMQSDYPDKIVNNYPNVESDPETVKESNAEADNIIPIDFTDIETDLAIAKDGLEISKKSLEVYLSKSTADKSHAKTDLTLVRKSSVSLEELLEESPKYEWSDVSVRTVESSEPGVMEESESELITAKVSPESESPALNQVLKIKPNQMEPVDFMDNDVYPAVVKDKLHDTKIRREYPDVEPDLLKGSEIPEDYSLTESVNDFTAGESDTVAPTDSEKSVLNFAKEGPDSMTLSVTSGESRPEADRDAPDGKSKTVTKKISPRNEFDKMQPFNFPSDEPVSVLASECPEHAIVPITCNTLQGNLFLSVEVCLGDSVSETVNVLDEKQNKNSTNKLQENKSIPICANELPEMKSEPPSHCEEFEESDLKYVAQLPECEIIKIISNKVGTIESINNISESQTDVDSEHSSLNLQFSPDEYGNNENVEEIYELYEVCSPHEALSEQKDNSTEKNQNPSHKREQITKHKLQKIENFEVEDSKLRENETLFLSVDPRTSSNFNASPLKSRTNGDIDDIASNIYENESISKIEIESTNSEHVHEELENDIKKQVASLKRGKEISEKKVGVKVEITKKSKGSKIAKGIQKVFSNLISDEVDAAATRLRTKHYPPTSIAQNAHPEDFQVTQDKISKGSGESAKDQDSGDSSSNTSTVKRSFRSRSQEPTSVTSQNAKKLDSRSRKSSAGIDETTEVESSVTTVTKKKAPTPDTKSKEHLAVSVLSSPRKATRSNAFDCSQSVESQEESSSTPKKKNIRTSKETVSECRAKGISSSNTFTIPRSNSTTTRENETSFLSVDSETSNSNISPLKSGTSKNIDNCQSYISEYESLSSTETEYATSAHMHELKSDIKKQVASHKRGKKPSESKIEVKVETPKKSNKGSKIAKGIPKVLSSNLLSDEVDTAPTRLRIKHYPATSLAKDVIPENSQVPQDKTRNLFGKDNKDKNSEDSSTSKFPLRRSLRSRSQDPMTSTSPNIKKPGTLSQRSSGGTGKISKSFSQVERSVTRKKQVQTPDIKLKEHIAIATRSTLGRSARYNVLDHTQSGETQEESNSTPKKTNMRTSNRIALASKSKERSILSTSTTSASTRSNVNASTTTRKTRTKN